MYRNTIGNIQSISTNNTMKIKQLTILLIIFTTALQTFSQIKMPIGSKSEVDYYDFQKLKKNTIGHITSDDLKKLSKK